MNRRRRRSSYRPVYRNNLGQFRRETPAEFMRRWPLVIAHLATEPMTFMPAIRT